MSSMASFYIKSKNRQNRTILFRDARRDGKTTGRRGNDQQVRVMTALAAGAVTRNRCTEGIWVLCLDLGGSCKGVHIITIC